MAYDKLVDSAKLDGALTATADAIRSVKDSTDPIEWDAETGFADALSDVSGASLPTQEKSITITENGTVEVLPDEGYALSKVTATAQVYDAVDDRVTQLIDGTLTVLESDDATSVPEYRFYHDPSIQSVSLPNVTDIGKYAFRSSSALQSVSLGSVTFWERVFEKCTALKVVSISNLTPNGGGIFADCTSLEQVDLGDTRYVGNNAYNETFSGCTSLSYINAPKATLIGDLVFKGCTALKTASFPILSKLNASAFVNSGLISIDIGPCQTIGSSAFFGATKLNTIIIRYEKRCTLGSSALSSTPFASNGTGGICLVPRSLIESYPIGTNWSTLYAAGTCLFWALEDYTVDGTITGEINWDKLNTDREGAFTTV